MPLLSGTSEVVCVGRAGLNWLHRVHHYSWWHRACGCGWIIAGLTARVWSSAADPPQRA